MSEPLVCIGSCNRAWRRAQVEYEEAKRRYPDLLAQYEADVAAAMKLEGAAYDHVVARIIRPEPPEKPTLTPHLGEPIWCSRCMARIRSALNELDDLAGVWQAMADGHRGVSEKDRVSGSSEGATPSPIADALDELYGDLRDIEDNYREWHPELGDTPYRGGRGAFARSMVVGWLTAHIDGILAEKGASDAGEMILRWHARIQAAAKAKPEMVRKAAPCPRCQQRSLVLEVDRDLVRCSNEDCNRVMSREDYDDLADVAAGAAAGLAS